MGGCWGGFLLLGVGLCLILFCNLTGSHWDGWFDILL